MKDEIYSKLEKLALNASKPFCLSCYVDAPKGICPKCHSDDLARKVSGIGVDWGFDWVIKHLLEEKLIPVNMEVIFEDHVCEIYPVTVQVGWMKFDTVQVIKELDPVSWRIAKDEYETQLESEDQIMSFDNGTSFYWIFDLESLIE